MDRALQTEPTAIAADEPYHGCARCGRTLRPGWGFSFKAKPDPAGQALGAQLGQVFKCITCALRHMPMLRRSLTVAIVVGSVLTLLNQGDVILAGNWKTALYWKIPLTFCVPFCVATYGALTNSRH